MKRSEINKALKELEKMIADHQYYLPKFANFTPEEWKTKGHEFDEIRDNMLGWDITDYGMGDFDKYGFSLFTIRNGNIKMKDKYKKPYAEKFLYLKEGQYALNHFHWYKMEDIINRGGGNILIRVYNSLPDEEIDKEGDVTVHIDGEVQVVPAGTQVKLEPGMSITIMQGMYHDFEVEPGTGPVLIGVMTTILITALIHQQEDFLRSKRMSHHIVCSATNIRKLQKNKNVCEMTPEVYSGVI